MDKETEAKLQKAKLNYELEVARNLEFGKRYDEMRKEAKKISKNIIEPIFKKYGRACLKNHIRCSYQLHDDGTWIRFILGDWMPHFTESHSKCFYQIKYEDPNPPASAGVAGHFRISLVNIDEKYFQKLGKKICGGFMGCCDVILFEGTNYAQLLPETIDETLNLYLNYYLDTKR